MVLIWSAHDCCCLKNEWNLIVLIINVYYYEKKVLFSYYDLFRCFHMFFLYSGRFPLFHPLYWFGYFLPTFYNEKCREFRMSGGSGSRHNWFCNYWPSCRALLGLWSTRTLVRSTLVNSHILIGQLDPWSCRTSTELKSTRPSIFFAPFRIKKLLKKSNCFRGWTLLTVKPPVREKFSLRHECIKTNKYHMLCFSLWF